MRIVWHDLLRAVSGAIDPVAPTDAIAAVAPTVQATPTAPAAAPRQLARWQTLNRILGQRADYATRVVPLREPDAAWNERLKLIASAEKSILVTLYNIGPDARGLEFLDALIAKAKEGKKVVLGVDFFSQKGLETYYSDFDKKRLFYKLRELKFYGGTVGTFCRPELQLGHLGAGMHAKALVVDNARVIVGGRNMSKHYFEKWADFDVLLEGPVASRVAEQTIALLSRANVTSDVALVDLNKHLTAYKDLMSELALDAQIKTNRARRAATERFNKGENPGPMFQMFTWDPVRARRKLEPEANPLTAALVANIEMSKEEILLSSNFASGGEVIAALIRARKRGVRVVVITSGPKTCDLSLLPYINARPSYDALKAAGVEVRETTTRMEHGKLYLFDRTFAAWGSYNVEPHADVSLVEDLGFTDDRAVVDAVRAALEDDINNHSEVMSSPGLPDSVRPFDHVLGWLLSPFV